MKTLKALFWTDAILIIHWFEKERLSKLVILAGFISLFFSLSVFIFHLSQVFFRNFSVFENYGSVTADYILHASIVMILWFAICSSTVSTITFLLTSSCSRDYLLTLPVSSSSLTIWFFLRTSFINLFLLLIVVMPIAISYAKVFGDGFSIIFIFSAIYIIFSLVVISGSLGVIIGFLAVKIIKKRQTYAVILSISLFLLISYLLVELIFPRKLISLYEVPAEQFFSLYSKLPLSSTILPSRWFVDVLTSGFGSSMMYILIVTIILVYTALLWQSHQLIRVLQDLRGEPELKYKKHLFSSSMDNFINSQQPLVLKDWYSITRSPSEVGYSLFLLSLMIFFFLFLWRSTSFNSFNPSYSVDILLYSFIWLVFFATSFFLRIIFPLLAREGSAIWYIFTIPILRICLFQSKLKIGIISSFPLIFTSFILWIILPFASSKLIILSFFSIIGILVLAQVDVLLGMISPNFSQGQDPEKVSTSSMGLFTLFISFVVGAILVVPLKMYFLNKLDIYYSTGIALVGCAIILFLIYMASRYFLDRYNFES